MSLATQIIDQQVSGIVEQYADVLAEELRLRADEHKKRSAAFLFLVAKTAFGLSDEEAFDGIVDGGNDFGVDALYFAQPVDGELPITVMQGKYKTDLSGDSAFPENAIAQIIAAIDTLFDPGKDVRLNARLEQRVEEVRSFVREGVIPRITAVAANNGTRWTAQAQQRIDNAAERYNGQVAWRYIGAEDLLALLQANRPIDAELKLAGQGSVETFNFRRVLIGRMPVAELARLADEHDNQLFEKNIRRFLGLVGNRVNEAMAATLRDPDQRPNFYFYNNGITVTCSQFRHNALQQHDWTVRVNDLQIVNGGQTARTVQQVHREGTSLEGAEVLVRIYELQQDRDDAEIVDAITFATNSQNPVDLRDLKANDPRQTALQESIAGLGYTYRVKREDRPVSPDEFTSAVIAEAVLSIWREKPHRARFRSEHFSSLYDTIFAPDLNGSQAIIAALLLRYAEDRRKRPPEDAPDFLAYGSRFIAMLMGRYLLEDMDIEEIEQLDHRKFEQARVLVEEKSEEYLKRAEQRIGEELDWLFRARTRERTLQRLSATFRGMDLLDMLLL